MHLLCIHYYKDIYKCNEHMQSRSKINHDAIRRANNISHLKLTHNTNAMLSSGGHFQIYLMDHQPEIYSGW